MVDIANLQQLLGNVQSQLSTVSSMAGQMNSNPGNLLQLLGMNPTMPPDIAGLVRSMVAEEMAKQKQLAAPVEVTPSSAPSVLTSAAPQLAAPIEAPLQSTPPQLPAPSQDMNTTDLMMKEFLNQIRLAIGGGLTGDQQIWLSSHIMNIPTFLKTDDGKACVQHFLTQYKKTQQ